MVELQPVFFELVVNLELFPLFVAPLVLGVLSLRDVLVLFLPFVFRLFGGDADPPSRRGRLG